MKRWQKAARDILEAAFIIVMLILVLGLMAAGLAAVVYYGVRWIFYL